MNFRRPSMLMRGVLAIADLATAIGRYLEQLQGELGTGRGHRRARSTAAIRPSSVVDAARCWRPPFALAARSCGQVATVLLFGLISFWALREFITLTPTRLGDHRTLFWVFFLFTPLQYMLVGIEPVQPVHIVIPVYAFLFIPARVALAGDYKRFLERTAKIQCRADGLASIA